MGITMQALLETTGGEFKRHTYIINDDGKLFAFRKAGDIDIKTFIKPKIFYKSGRKFTKLEMKKLSTSKQPASTDWSLLRSGANYYLIRGV